MRVQAPGPVETTAALFDDLVDPVVVVRPERHGVDAGGVEDQCQLVVGVPDVGPVGGQRRAFRSAAVQRCCPLTRRRHVA